MSPSSAAVSEGTRPVSEEAGPATTLILLSAPKAVDFYPPIGLKRHETCWVFP
jgi:hypothetical protein